MPPDLKRWSIKCSIATVLIINEDLHASSDMPHGCKSRVAYVWERQGDLTKLRVVKSEFG